MQAPLSWAPRTWACALVCALAACGASRQPAVAGSTGDLPPLLAADGLPPPLTPTGAPDGDDDGPDDGAVALAEGPSLRALAAARRARFEPLPPAPGAHPLVCDLASFGGLVAATAVAPIDKDGARLHRFAGGAWELLFDWDRGSEPGAHEVGGQGLPRVRVLGGRLWVPDGDAPLFGGFGRSGAPFEDYLFVSEPDGRFPPLGPELSPPASTRVLPFAFHVFDVTRVGDVVIASGGTLALDDRTGTPYPGGLFAGRASDPLLLPRWFLGSGRRVGVVRATFLHRYGSRLYVGLQNNERRVRWDLAVLGGDLAAVLAGPAPNPTPLVLARVTADGGWLTRRFASEPGHLWWIASGSPHRADRRPARLFLSRDGARFDPVPLPDGAGAPQDLLPLAGARYLLTTRGLYRARGDAPFTLLAPAPPGDPFGAFDLFCSAPLAAHDDALYAGSTRDGTVYRVVAAP